jgi:hypothetical protein
VVVGAVAGDEERTYFLSAIEQVSIGAQRVEDATHFDANVARALVGTAVEVTLFLFFLNLNFLNLNYSLSPRTDNCDFLRLNFEVEHAVGIDRVLDAGAGAVVRRASSGHNDVRGSELARPSRPV